MGQCEKCKGVFTVEDWLFGCVNFEVPKEAILTILGNRGVDILYPYADRESLGFDVRLLKADLLRWMVLGPSKVNSVSDSDNGWSHSGGGYTLTDNDKKLLMDEANAIYDELEPESVFGKTKIRMRSLGIMPAYRDDCGMPLERKVR
jgi:hypothetical protein